MAADDRITWKVLLAREMGEKAYIIVAFCIGVGLCAYFLLGGSLLWATVASLVFFIYFGEVFFNREYTMDEKEISCSTWYFSTSREWDDFRRIEEFTYGVVLLTRAKRGRFDFLRSMKVYLPNDSEEREPLMKFIRQKVEKGDGQQQDA
ncbi:MAG: hypothetical protein U5N86_13270 [Planctomycetota bacterium]|nr:hypothetical protein [Planctomycetota bacterium]